MDKYDFNTNDNDDTKDISDMISDAILHSAKASELFFRLVLKCDDIHAIYTVFTASICSMIDSMSFDDFDTALSLVEIIKQAITDNYEGKHNKDILDKLK